VLNFYHRQVGDYVRQRFLDSPSKRRTRHERLADYFHAQDYWRESLEDQRKRSRALPPTPRPANVQKVDELPWQCMQPARLSGQWDEVGILFTDLFFLEAHLPYSGITH
jgi:hypothetical protein